MAARDPGVRRTRASRLQDLARTLFSRGFLSRLARRTKRKEGLFLVNINHHITAQSSNVIARRSLSENVQIIFVECANSSRSISRFFLRSIEKSAIYSRETREKSVIGCCFVLIFSRASSNQSEATGFYINTYPKLTVQKYLMTFGCASDSRRRST